METLNKPIEKPMQTACRRRKKFVGRRKMGREEAKYWGLWSEIWNKFKVPVSEQPQWRRELRREVLGSERTQSTFTHGDYDVIIGAMRALLQQDEMTVSPESIIEAYMDGEARRTLHLIEGLNMPPAYVAAISRNKFGTTNWQIGLLPHEVLQLFYTCKARKASAERRGKPLYNNSVQNKPTESDSVESDEDDFLF